MEGYTADFTDSDEVTVTLRLPRHHALALAWTLRHAAESTKLDRETAKRWVRLSRALHRRLKEPHIDYRSRVVRPMDGPPCEPDIEQVIHGEPPYPVLSHQDAQEAWERMERMKRSARHIAERLHTTERTVVRWRKRRREGKPVVS